MAGALQNAIFARSLQSGRRPRARSLRRVRSCFNRRPLFAERATRGWNALMIAPQVSIRARSLQSGRRRSRCRLQPQRLRFNPRPLFAERATNAVESVAHSLMVSIRARSLQSGRLDRALRGHAAIIGFNPRPLFAERATPRCQVVVAKAEGRHFARTRVAASHDDTATRHAKVRDQVIRCAAPCANLPALRRRTGFARQTTSGPSKSVARKRPYSLTRSSVGSVMR